MKERNLPEWVKQNLELQRRGYAAVSSEDQLYSALLRITDRVKISGERRA